MKSLGLSYIVSTNTQDALSSDSLNLYVIQYIIMRKCNAMFAMAKVETVAFGIDL